MKVLLVNGSPHKNGCTYTALVCVAEALNKNGIATEIFHIGTKPIAGCIDCKKCFDDNACVVDDVVNKFAAKAKNADGLVVGSPVYYASANGSLLAFLNRLFTLDKDLFKGKPAAAVVSCRRGGAATAVDQLNKYFAIRQMPIVTSQYWNMIHGNTPDEVRQDLEGLQTMRVLGNNMAWLLRCIEAGKKEGIVFKDEPKIRTNFIR